MVRVFLYPAWSLYPQIFPLEIDEGKPIRSAAAELFSVPEKLISIYDEKLETINGAAAGGLQPDSRIGVSIENIPYRKSMFEIGQTSSASLNIPEPSIPKVSPSPAFRKDVLMSENEHQLVRLLVPFDVSDNLERFEEINLHELLPYRRPGDPQVTVTIQLMLHLSRNNTNDLETMRKVVEKIRQEAAKPDKFDRYRIEIDLNLFVNTVESSEAEWLPWVSGVIDHLLHLDKDLRTHATIGPFNRIYVHSYDQLTVSKKQFDYRKQCIEGVAKLHYLLKHHPVIGENLKQEHWSAFNTLPEPMENVLDGFTRREVAFFLDPELIIPLTARWTAAEMILENFNTNDAKILQKADAYAREILGCVGLLPQTSNVLNISVPFGDAGGYYQNLTRKMPLKVGNITLDYTLMERKQKIKELENLLFYSSYNWSGKGPGFFFANEKVLDAATRLVTIAQITALRSVLHQVCQRLSADNQYQLLYATLEAVHHLLDLAPIGDPSLLKEEQGKTGKQNEVRKYLEDKAVEERTTFLNHNQEIKKLIKKAKPNFFKRIFLGKALRKARANLIAALSKEIGRFLKHEAYAIVEKNLLLGSGFTAAWHLAQRYKPKAEAERRHINLMVKEFKRNQAHLLVSLNTQQKEKVAEWQDRMKTSIAFDKTIKANLDAKIQKFLENFKIKGFSRLESGLFQFIDEKILPDLEPIIDKLTNKHKINLTEEMREKIKHFLNYPGFQVGYMKRKNPGLIREAHQAFHIFTPPLSPGKKKEMEELVNDQRTDFSAVSKLVEVPGMLESIIVMEYFFCSLSCFAPEPFWDTPGDSKPTSTGTNKEEYL